MRKRNISKRPKEKKCSSWLLYMYVFTLRRFFYLRQSSTIVSLLVYWQLSMRHPNQRRETPLRELNTQSWAPIYTFPPKSVLLQAHLHLSFLFISNQTDGQKALDIFFSFRFLYSDIIRFWISLHCIAQITQNTEIAFTNSVSHKQIKTFWWVSRYCVSILIDAAQVQCFFSPLTFSERRILSLCWKDQMKTKIKTMKTYAHKPFFSLHRTPILVYSVCWWSARASECLCFLTTKLAIYFHIHIECSSKFHITFCLSVDREKNHWLLL